MGAAPAKLACTGYAHALSRTFAALHPGQALYCGPIQHLETHLYGADVLHVGIYRPFRIRLAGGSWQSSCCALVPAGIRHALDMAGGIHGKLFLERERPDAPAFRRRFPFDAGAIRRFDDAETIDCLRRIHEEDPSRTEAAGRIAQLLDAPQAEAAVIDPRIRHAIEQISRKPDRNFSQQELAAVGLSPSSFLHLFRQHTGLPYRRFRNWKRMLAALALLQARDHLTRPALDAGYADATHFSHSFRDTFGVNPAPVFRNIARFEIGATATPERGTASVVQPTGTS